MLSILLSGCGNGRFGTRLPEDYNGLTEEQIVERLPSDSFVVFRSLGPIPEGWPDRTREIALRESVELGPIRCVDWWMTYDGTNWQRFYGFVLDKYLDDFKLEPAMIYERRSVQEGFAVVPVMSLFFNQAGQATNSSRTWCDVVRKSVMERKRASNQALHGD